MAGVQPVAVYAMKVPPGDILVPAVPDFAAMFRVSMAAIDPSAEPDLEEAGENKTARATLKIIRFPSDLLDDSDEDDDFDDYDDLLDGDSEDDSEDEEENGGPSKRPSKKEVLKALAEAEAADAMDEDEDDDEEDSEDDEEAARAILAKIKKGKAKAEGDDEEDSDEDDDEDESLEVDEVVVCTLDPEKHYQQPLDIVVGENERIFFKVTGTHTVHLTGNYVIPLDDGQASLYDDEDEDDYDLSPDEDELDELEDDEESDELDDIDDPRVMEVDDDEEEAPKLVKAKGKNKRPAEESEEENLDDLIAKAGKTAEEPKLSKSQEKKQKKQKKNDGEAAAVAPEAAKAAANGEKKVQFAKNLEQGPTPSPAPAKDAKKDEKTTGSLGQKVVGGVTIDDKKLGKGPAAKKGDRVGMRYIGKLENGKVFDSNKKGKPFQFKLGAGEVIKGWDIGIAGLAVGGERRITIPAHLGYGSRGAPPDIPPNSKLIFDVKMLEIK